MNRWTRLFITLTLVFLVFWEHSASADAAERDSALQIAVESVNAIASSTIDVNVTVRNNPGILGATLEVSYSNELKLLDAKSGEAFSNLNFTKPGMFDSPCRFMWDGEEILAENVRDGVILILTFQLPANGQSSQDYFVNISAEDGSVVNNDLTVVPVQASGGIITLKDRVEDVDMISSTSAFLRDGTVSVTIYSNTSCVGTNLALVGFSNNGQMCYCEIKPENIATGENSFQFEVTDRSLTYKVLLLDEDMCPCCASIAVNLPESTIETEVAALLAVDYTNPTIVIDDSMAAPGEDAVISVRIVNNPGVLGATLVFDFDEMLSLKSAEAGNAFGSLNMSRPGTFVPPCRFLWDGDNVSSGNIQDGTILTLTFEVSPDAEMSSDLSISASYALGDVIDVALNPVQLDLRNGTVTVQDFIYGDLNGDRAVNTTDVILMRRSIVGGYTIHINEAAADVNTDDAVNTTDIILLRRFIVGGYNIVFPYRGQHTHTLRPVPYKTPTQTEDGNIAYWHCSGCMKCFSDEAGMHEILPAETIIPKLSDSRIHTVLYEIANGDSYLQQLQREGKIENPYSDTFDENEGLVLNDKEFSVSGYKFLGWYDGAGSNAAEIKKIEPGTTHNVTLYAHWSEESYNVVYKTYMTPLAQITDSKYLHYTVSKGLVDLPNPTLYNYIFLGWYTDDGEEIQQIPAGSIGDITLNAYWTSKRNLAKKVSRLRDPIVLEDRDNGVFYFTYELGTVENVPLSTPYWTIQSVAGLANQKSETKSKEISQTQARAITETLSKETVDSATWTLSTDWNDTVQVNESWANQHGMTQEEANTMAKSSSNTYSVTDSHGGSDTQTNTDGTTTLTYDSQNHTHGNSAHFDAKLEGSYSNEGNVSSKIAGTYKVGLALEGGYEQHQETNEHTGTDTTDVDTTVTTHTDTFNNSATSSVTKQASESSTVSKALSEIISNTYGYGKSYSSGGESSESQGFSSSQSASVSSTSTFTYFTSSVTSETSTYSTDGKSEGCYRLVLAGTVHVFGVVGYHVASQSYFTYTFNVLDDNTYEFLDYSPDLQFSDYENSVIPFEIPYFVYEYVAENIASTEGLRFRTNSINKTAVVSAYDGDCSDVIVPSYITSGGFCYKVTGFSSTAFAGKPIRAIILGKNIDEIPDSAFEDCDGLEEISGYFTKIGDSAFSGCTKLSDFTVSQSVWSIGRNAFADVPRIQANVISGDNALAAARTLHPNTNEQELNVVAQELTQNVVTAIAASGAQEIVMDLSVLGENRSDLLIEIPQIHSFELLGGRKNFPNLKLTSSAETTVLRNLTISECDGVPLEIDSANLTLDTVSVSSPDFSLKLSAETTNLSLIRDNRLASQSGRAIVSRGLAFQPVSTGYTEGTLDVSGNVCHWGSVSGTECLSISHGSVILITEEEYRSYIIGSYTLYFDADGGTCDTLSRDVSSGVPIGLLPSATKTGYTLSGWYTADGQPVSAETVFSDGQNHTLYAHWNAVTCTVSFDGTGGNPSYGSQSVTYGNVYGSMPSAYRTGHTFAGWFTSSSGGNQVEVSSVVQSVENHTLYAHWQVNTYTVYFDGAGGSANFDRKTVAFDSSYGSLPSASRTGYTFAGWFTSPDGGGRIEEWTTMQTADNHTLYAHWDRVYVTIPDFTGWSADDAKNWCSQNGIGHGEEWAYDWSRPWNQVRSNSHSGWSVEYGTSITLYISSGEKPIQVGDAVWFDGGYVYGYIGGPGIWKDGSMVNDYFYITNIDYVGRGYYGFRFSSSSSQYGWVPAELIHQRTN